MLEGRDKSQLEHELQELHVSLTGQTVTFAAAVPEGFAPFAAKYGNASYHLLFSVGPPSENKTCVLNQAVLALEGCCFYLHALDRALFRGDDERLRETAYDSSVSKLVRFLADSFRNLYHDRAPSASEIIYLVNERNAAYGLALIAWKGAYRSGQCFVLGDKPDIGNGSASEQRIVDHVNSK